VTTTGPLDPLLQYGLAGLLAFFIGALALFIRNMYEKRLAEKDVIIAEKKAELVEARKLNEQISPALTEVSRVRTLAITVIGTRSGGGQQ